MNQTINHFIQNIGQLSQNIAHMNQNISVQPIAFDARLSHGIASLGDQQTIVYDKIVTNIGNGYDSRNSYFSAPVNGVYMIAVSGMAEHNEYIELSIVKNGTPIGFVRSGFTNDYESGTTVLPLFLAKGDMIWVRHVSSTLGKIHGYGWNTFSGFLIATV
ncbi:hypothetical protein KUTeg_023008 [Tegillarca granosa]|uniref:C1q domain-containing protein n=1 Tax=Tegillarca granosa TaxID=220873 RepID=A0ABQ9E6N2_TEGGR|nr:hypothetical protein KUTeg_023008 [Tegillarca granosa]